MAKRKHSKKLSFREQSLLHSTLKAVLSEQGNGLWKYADGYSDQRIASDLSIGIATVRRFRQAEFGQLPVGGGSGAGGPIGHFMTKTNARLDAIERALGISPSEASIKSLVRAL